jgi:hypothetical protein
MKGNTGADITNRRDVAERGYMKLPPTNNSTAQPKRSATAASRYIWGGKTKLRETIVANSSKAVPNTKQVSTRKIQTSIFENLVPAIAGSIKVE